MLLLTPGPLTTSRATRDALRHDHGSRDPAFVRLAEGVRARITELVSWSGRYTTVPVQGSGTFAVEAMVGTLIPRDGRAVVLVNGAYGQRIVDICRYLGRPCTPVRVPEGAPVNLAAVETALAEADVTHLVVVHSETTTGEVNPLAELAARARAHDRRLLVDAMSSFGALPIDLDALGITAIAASANKCLEGVPGLAFVVARSEELAASGGNSHSLALDLHDQWRRLERDGQYRFTPPTHVLAALASALDQHAAEGGCAGRLARYSANRDLLVAGLRGLGFRTLLPDDRQGPIIVTFHAPAHPGWDFERFYDALLGRGFAIYPGKLTEAPTFRVGCIGQVFPDDIRRFVAAVAEVTTELGLGHADPKDGG